MRLKVYTHNEYGFLHRAYVLRFLTRHALLFFFLLFFPLLWLLLAFSVLLVQLLYNNTLAVLCVKVTICFLCEWMTDTAERESYTEHSQAKSFSFVRLVWFGLACSLYSSYSLRAAFALFSACCLRQRQTFTHRIHTWMVYYDRWVFSVIWSVGACAQMNNTACKTERFDNKFTSVNEYIITNTSGSKQKSKTTRGNTCKKNSCAWIACMHPVYVWMFQEWLSVQWKYMHRCCICIGEEVSNKQLTDCVVYYISFFLGAIPEIEQTLN